MATIEELKKEKVITLTNLQSMLPFIERNIPVFTMAEYEQKKDTIPSNTFFVISDDSVTMTAVQEMAVTEKDLYELVNKEEENDGDDDILDDLFP